MKKFLMLFAALWVGFAFAEAPSEDPVSESTASESVVTANSISKKELFSRARDALKTSLETGNKERASQALAYLQKNLSEGAPLIRFEEYLINMELGDFENGIAIYTDLRREVLDRDYKPKRDVRIQVDDPLAVYLRRNLSDYSRVKADSLYARVENSDIKEETKKLYKAMLYSEIVFEDTATAEAFIRAAKDYAMYHPTSPYAEVFTKQTIPYVESFLKPLRAFREDPLAHKYYTGGLGTHVYTWTGFMSGDIMDVAEDKMGSAFMADVTMRIWRLSLNAFLAWGLITEPKLYDEDAYWSESEDESIGLTIGFTAFDSRYLRVEPFLGFGASYFMGDELASDDFVLGCNADFRFWASKPARMGAISVAFDLRLKYMFQLGTFSDYNLTDESDWSANRHTFAIGLGVELW
jgi:hypothetical protein